MRGQCWPGLSCRKVPSPISRTPPAGCIILQKPVHWIARGQCPGLGTTSGEKAYNRRGQGTAQGGARSCRGSGSSPKAACLQRRVLSSAKSGRHSQCSTTFQPSCNWAEKVLLTKDSSELVSGSECPTLSLSPPVVCGSLPRSISIVSRLLKVTYNFGALSWNHCLNQEGTRPGTM